MSKSSWKASTHCGLPAKPRLVYEGTVLHDQEQSPGLRRTAMAMKYQKGTPSEPNSVDRGCGWHQQAALQHIST